MIGAESTGKRNAANRIGAESTMGSETCGSSVGFLDLKGYELSLSLVCHGGFTGYRTVYRSLGCQK